MPRLPVSLLSIALAVACSSDDSGSSQTKPTPSKTLVYTATPDASGASISLREKELTETRLVVELVGHSLGDVYGAAFRLKYDASVLDLEQLQVGTIWAGATVGLATEKTPGLTVGVVTKKGDANGVDASNRVLATVSFTLKQKQPTALDFVPNRNSVIDSAGGEVTATWTGGSLALK